MRRLLLAALVLLGACADDDGASPTTAPEGATTTDGRVALALRGDGLGTVAFGDAIDPVVDRLTTFLGEPTDDDGWIERPGCLADDGRIRTVYWNGLGVTFADRETDVGGGEHMWSWSMVPHPEGPELLTHEGVGVRSTMDDLVATYGDDAEIIPGITPAPPTFRVETSTGPLTGVLNGVGEIDSISAGGTCGE